MSRLVQVSFFFHSKPFNGQCSLQRQRLIDWDRNNSQHNKISLSIWLHIHYPRSPGAWPVESTLWMETGLGGSWARRLHHANMIWGPVPAARSNAGWDNSQMLPPSIQSIHSFSQPWNTTNSNQNMLISLASASSCGAQVVHHHSSLLSAASLSFFSCLLLISHIRILPDGEMDIFQMGRRRRNCLYL